ncbi:MAG: DUF6250 domain-containing protein [Deltaproteobacteria bacterium]
MPDDISQGTGAGTPSPRLIALSAALVLIAVLPLLAYALRPRASTLFELRGGWSDDFNRPELGDDYWSSGAYWRIASGELLSPGAKNNPLWLRAALPDDVQVDFDARSESPEGDTKCEIFGNGYDHASGYIVIFGGWGNTISTIGRLDEHGVPVAAALPEPLPNGGHVRVERRDLHVEQGRTYHWTIRRQGGTLAWSLDGQPVIQIVDPEPLRGPGHDRFAFSTWDADVFYDNLKISPL